jgi:alkanesulfonate monooxygenase SsuD/methylene tetrahydromethanopterin reductase-like flavin-dependent oxidoreductase (luciferase family)
MRERAAATLSAVGFDAAALKPGEVDLGRVPALDIDLVAIDYEGREHVPDEERLADLASTFELFVTEPVRADGYDPFGDDSLRARVPEGVGEVLVAGNGAYLSAEERRRAVAPRLDAASTGVTDLWVGTEGIERIALAVGGTQYDLLSRSTAREVNALRTAGLDTPIAVYAPTVLTDDEDAVLDAVGAYAGRRRRVRARLPDDAPRDHTIGGEARETLLSACREYALVGDPKTVATRVDELHEAGVDHVVGYPARGLDPVLPS